MKKLPKRRKRPLPPEERVIIKTPEQIEGIRKSCKLAARCLDMIGPHVVAGVTTGKLNDILEEFIRDHGAIPACLGYKGFPKAVCISVNEVICHGIPGEYVLKDGDILNIDVTTILNGFYGDTSFMYWAGEPSQEAKHLLYVTNECLARGITEVKPGAHISNIGYEINKFAVENGCSVVDFFCGHGTGLEFHEPPQVIHSAPRKGNGIQLLPGHIITLEPMINLGKPDVKVLEDGWTAVTVDGKLSAQYEHTLLISDSGVEILTL